MVTFILIPGGWQGGWIYQQVADILTVHGHRAMPITLPASARLLRRQPT